MGRRPAGQAVLARTLASMGAAGLLLIAGTQGATAAPGDPVDPAVETCLIADETTPETTSTTTRAAETTTTTTLPDVECTTPEGVITDDDLPTTTATTTAGTTVTSVETTVETSDTTSDTATEPTETTTPATTPSISSATSTTSAPTRAAARDVQAAADAIDGFTVTAPAIVNVLGKAEPGEQISFDTAVVVSNINVARGWTTSVSLSNPRQVNGETFVPTNAKYVGPSANCGIVPPHSARVEVAIGPTPVVAKTGPLGCNTSWTATVSFTVPNTGVVAGNYSTVLTHSIY